MFQRMLRCQRDLYKSVVIYIYIYLFIYLFIPPPYLDSPPVAQGLLSVDISRSHSDTPHSLGLLWTNDRPLCIVLYLTTHNTHYKQSSIPTP